MKNHITLFKLNTNQPLKLCLKLLQSLGSLRCSYSQWVSKLKVEMKKGMRLVRLDTLSTRVASLTNLVKSERFYAGLTLVVLGLLSKHLYQVFDPAVKNEIIYYQNLYWYFWTIRLQLNTILFSLGVFVVFPSRNHFRWIVILNMFDATMEIIHYSFYTTSYETFHMPFHWTVQVLGYTLPVLLLFVAEFVAWAFNHRVLAFESRMDGLYQIADDVSDSKFKSMFKTAWGEKREFKKQY